jgi:hypothetical protein
MAKFGSASDQKRRSALGKIVVPLFVIALIAVSIWIVRFQYFDREQDGRKYTTRQNIFSDEECYFLGDFKQSELKSLGLVHCAVVDQ